MAGSGVVHFLGGTCALVAAIFLGPRIGRFKDGKPVDKPGHSMAVSTSSFIKFVPKEDTNPTSGAISYFVLI